MLVYEPDLLLARVRLEPARMDSCVWPLCKSGDHVQRGLLSELQA